MLPTLTQDSGPRATKGFPREWNVSDRLIGARQVHPICRGQWNTRYRLLKICDRSCRIWVCEICLSSAAKTIPCGGVFRFEGHAAFHLIDPIAMDPVVSYPDSNRLKYENRRHNETAKQQRSP